MAGPGTGKTRTFAHRVAYLLQDKQISASDILAVTFTRSAAQEMKERLKTLVTGMDLSSLWINTFHAFALRMLQEQDYPFGLGKDVSILREEQKSNFLEGLVPGKERKAFLEALRQKKQRLLWPDETVEKAYQQRVHAARCLDFDDLFLYLKKLFEERPVSRS